MNTGGALPATRESVTCWPSGSATLALSSAIERAYQLYIALRGPTGATRHGKIVA